MNDKIMRYGRFYTRAGLVTIVNLLRSGRTRAGAMIFFGPRLFLLPRRRFSCIEKARQ